MTSITLIGVVLLLYLATAVSLFVEGDKGLALAFFAYALANVGFIISILDR